MDWKSYFYGVITVFVLLLVLTSFGLAHIGTKDITGNAVSENSGKLDTTDWSENEKMNYEMHGTIPARIQGQVSASALSDGTGAVSGSQDDIPEKCRVPAGQDVDSWKEHLGHHAETKECLQYF